MRKVLGLVVQKYLKAELNVHTFGDMLECYPFRYIDRSKFYKTTEINSDVAYVQLKGKDIKSPDNR